MKKQELLQVYAIIISLAPLFRRRCRVCHARCTTGKGFAIHHIGYVKGEKTWRDFKPDRLAYYKYLAPIVIRHMKDKGIKKKRFALVCNGDHHAVTKLLRYRKVKRKRLIRLVNESDNY